MAPIGGSGQRGQVKNAKRNFFLEAPIFLIEARSFFLGSPNFELRLVGRSQEGVTFSYARLTLS